MDVWIDRSVCELLMPDVGTPSKSNTSMGRLQTTFGAAVARQVLHGPQPTIYGLTISKFPWAHNAW
eukprot:scaffold30101_cov43-Prasinocladus_malaysianus.AAC.1